MQIALFQPDIAGNVGTILRTAACFGAPAHIIEPCGFPFSDQALRRAGMDYAVRANVRCHADWAAFGYWNRADGGRRDGKSICQLAIASNAAQDARHAAPQAAKGSAKPL